MKQVITIEPGGIMSGLQVKPGKGLDLTKFGPANVQRASEICWDDNEQRWFVQLTDRHSDLVEHHMIDQHPAVALEDYHLMTGNGKPQVPHSVDLMTGYLLFESYDDAVAVEIEFLNAARLKGFIT